MSRVLVWGFWEPQTTRCMWGADSPWATLDTADAEPIIISMREVVMGPGRSTCTSMREVYTSMPPPPTPEPLNLRVLVIWLTREPLLRDMTRGSTRTSRLAGGGNRARPSGATDTESGAPPRTLTTSRSSGFAAARPNFVTAGVNSKVAVAGVWSLADDRPRMWARASTSTWSAWTLMRAGSEPGGGGEVTGWCASVLVQGWWVQAMSPPVSRDQAAS
mmetsp:Transcript_4519/g.9725  ORF Transcript_4519/g.9725 Transcript_4519/m.9725 type:complete len:218 (-) Transcript_4519:1024-1677(-)